MNEELILEKGQGIAYYQFGCKELITESELDACFEDFNVRKIYFRFDDKIRRLK